MTDKAAQLARGQDRPLKVPPPVDPDATYSDPWLGSVIADAYRIEHVIGEGGMGLLYKASHLRLDRAFAVKVIHEPLAQREDMRSRFEREARVMSQVKSDHVVDVIDVVTALGGRTCIVTELLEGLDLEAYLAAHGGKLGQADAAWLCRQCLRGLSAAHALSVVHRDLKPSNLFLARDTSHRVTLKILDFGVAKVSGDAGLTKTGIVVGTPSYMAPEQARGASFADQRSDIYAVGAVLYRMLTGVPPFEEEDATATLIRILQESPARPRTFDASIAPGLEAVVERAMARRPEDRYQSVEDFERDLAPFDHRDTLVAQGTKHRTPPKPASLNSRARLLRPMAVTCGAALSIAAGFATAVSLAMLVSSLSGNPALKASERMLVMLAAVLAFGTSAGAVRNALAEAWRSAPSVRAMTSRFAYTLAAGAAMLGWLELAALVSRVFVIEKLSYDSAPWAGARVLAASCVALWVLLRFRPRAVE